MKIFCVGRNYVAHAQELQNEIPEDPVIFMKPKTAALVNNNPMYYPEFTNELHYEGELVLRVSKNGKYIQEKYASRYYDQITVGIDFTARDLQQQQKRRGLPWEIAKSFDHSAAVGEFMDITPAISKGNINFSLYKNGELAQKANANEMVFTFDEIVAYISRFFTINIGDLIFTGTPSGTGPVVVEDRLEGYIEDENVLDIEIK